LPPFSLEGYRYSTCARTYVFGREVSECNEHLVKIIKLCAVSVKRAQERTRGRGTARTSLLKKQDTEVRRRYSIALKEFERPIDRNNDTTGSGENQSSGNDTFNRKIL